MSIIDSSFRPLLGRPCWSVTWDRHTGLWLEFGRPHLGIREPKESTAHSARVRRLFAYRRVWLHGDWTLAIDCGRWRLQLRDDRPVTGRSPERRIEVCISFLDGQQLLDVEVTSTGTTRLQFDLGAVLEVKGSDCEDGDMWTLYKRRRGLALTVRAGGEYSHGSASRAERWRKLPAAATLTQR